MVVVLFLVAAAAAADDAIFRFAPDDGVRFVRTLTRTARIEVGGMVRTETTILRARFRFRRTSSGFLLTMTPLSFRYVVNDRDTDTTVWNLIRGHDLRLRFNEVGNLSEIRGYESIDEELEKEHPDFSGPEANMHLDRLPIGAAEQETWTRQIFLWLSQPSVPGTKLEYDSKERGFTGALVRSHTKMQVLRAKACGAARCVSTIYSMVPDLDATRQRVNDHRNDDLIDATASETLEQTIEPATMLPHYQRLTWKANLATMTEAGKLSQDGSMTATSEFTYEPRGH